MLKTKPKSSALEKAREVIRIEADAVKQLEERIGQEFERATEMILNCHGKVVVTGIGKSGIVGRKIAATLSSTGTPAIFLHPTEGVHGDVGVVMRGDVVLIISKSGEMDELVQLLSLFKRLDVKIISFTCSVNSTLAKNSDVILDVSVKEEACPHDLAPTASTTATLAMGDALAIATYLQKGFTENDFALLHPGGALGRKLLIKVKDVMLTGSYVPAIPEDSLMKEAVLEMTSKRGVTSIVNKNGEVLGVITDGDLRRLVEKTEHVFEIPVKDVMTKNPKVSHPEDLGVSAVRTMEQYGVTSLLVVDDAKKLVGIIHLHDLMRAGVI